MPIILTIEESTQGLWRVCRAGAVLHDKLQFASAIRMAHGLARREHASTGRVVQVEMICTDFTIPLTQYGDMQIPRYFAA